MKDDERKTQDWKQEIQIDYKFQQYWDKILKMMEEFETRWKGY